MAKKKGPRLFSREEKLAKYFAQGGRCARCGQPFPFEEMEGDHIEPWSEDGDTDMDNLQMLCRPCNRRKGAS